LRIFAHFRVIFGCLNDLSHCGIERLPIGQVLAIAHQGEAASPGFGRGERLFAASLQASPSESICSELQTILLALSEMNLLAIIQAFSK
jgi:hypothetical protein